MRKLNQRVVLFFLIFLVSSVVSAREVLNGASCMVDADTKIEENLYVFCTEMVIDGEVDGSIIGIVRSAVINGRVSGSLYLLGGELNVNGVIGKDVHFGGVILNLNDGSSFENDNGSLLSANLSSTVRPTVEIPGSVISLGYQLRLDGNVNRAVNFWGSALSIDGHIKGNVDAEVGDTESSGVSSQIETLLIPFPFEVELVDPGLVVSRDAVIEGELEYSGPNLGDIQGQVGQITYNSTRTVLIGDTPQESAAQLGRYLEQVVREFLTLTLIGAVAIFFLREPVQSASRSLRVRPLSTFGVGMLAFILSFPIFLIIALISFLMVFILSFLPLDTVAIFSGLVLALANIGSASIFYFTAIYVARIIVALAIGRAVIRWFTGNTDLGTWRTTLATLVTGVGIISFINVLPDVGFAFNAMELFLGLGAILGTIQKTLRRFLESGAIRTTGTFAQILQPAPMLPAPAPMRRPQRILPSNTRTNPENSNYGTDNLPDGFDWWGED